MANKEMSGLIARRDNQLTRQPAGTILVLTAWVAFAGPACFPCGAAPNQAPAKPPEATPGNAPENNAPADLAGRRSEYRIGAGDVLAINIWNEPQSSVQGVVVRPDGKVSLPLVKEVDVLGLTPVELEKVLTAKLAHFINHPDVTVVVKEVHSKRVYLVGAVNKVGTVPLLSNMTVLQALAEAGGTTEYAKRKKIYVLREENGKQVKFPFNYEAVIKGDNMDQNIVLHPDDTIVVP
jgi:polysaccharide biosynthesis/export protein